MTKRAEFLIHGRELLAEPYHYDASGLNNIFLLNGVIQKETSYGPMIHIENVNGLHRAIGLHIVEKEEPMTGEEFRFLRKQLGLTQAKLAARLSVTDQTVANYEKNETSMGPAEPLIRAFYLLSVLPNQTRMEVLKPMVEIANVNRIAPVRLPQFPRENIVEGWDEPPVPQAA